MAKICFLSLTFKVQTNILSLSQIYIACFHSDIDTNSSGNCAIIIQTGHAKYANTSADCRYCMSSQESVINYSLCLAFSSRVFTVFIPMNFIILLQIEFHFKIVHETFFSLISIKKFNRSFSNITMKIHHQHGSSIFLLSNF